VGVVGGRIVTGDSLGEVIRRIGRSVSLQTDLALTDAQLLERFVARRDEPAFAALVARHGPMVLGVCRRLVRDAQESEDAFQATFLVLARKAAGIQRQPLLAGWLYGVASRVAVRLRGQTARRRTREERDVDLTALAAADDGADSEVRPLVHEEVGRLPDKYRSAIVLCYLEGKTNEEAALQLRWPVGSVKSRLARARDLLRTRLTRRGLTLSAGLLTSALVVNKASASPALVDATIRGAALFAAGDAVAGGVVTARAVQLSYGVLRTMIVTKAKIVAALALTVAMLGGAGGLAYRSLAAGPDDTPKAAPMKTESHDDRPKADKEKPKAGESKTDAEAIQGVWRVTAVETEGKERDDDRAKRIKSQEWTINADKIFIKVGARAQKEGCPYKMDPTKTPKTIDITERTVGGDGEVKSERTRRTIYSLEGDVLKVCYGMSAVEIKHDDQDVGRRPRPFDPRDLMDDGGRPTELATKEGSRSTLFTLKREPADKDKANDGKEAVKPPDDNAALQGTWQVIRIERGGRQILIDDPEWKKAWPDWPMKWVFKGNRLLRQGGGVLDTDSTYRLDSSKTPKQMDETVLRASPVDRGRTEDIPLIYSLEGDILKVCQPPDEVRPTELAVKRTNQNTVTTLKRVSAVAPIDAKQAETPRPSVNEKGQGERTLQDWRDAAKEAFRLHRELLEPGKVAIGTVIDAAQRLLDAELEGRTTQADRVATYEAHLSRVKDLMKVVNMKLDAGRLAPADAADGEAYLLKAEFLLEREKTK
jgi:RNA polymerase sigma factor (sigma-70 family)